MRRNKVIGIELIMALLIVTSTFSVGVLADDDILTVTKTVWDPTSQSWKPCRTAYVGDTVRFNITTTYLGEDEFNNLFNFHAKDILPANLQFVQGSARFINYMNAVPTERIIGNTLFWNFTVPTNYSLVLDTTHTKMFIEFNANVLYSEVETINNAQVIATESPGGIVTDEASATVIVPAIPVQKQVWNGNTWVESINATRNNIVKFKITILNHAAFAIKNMIIRDVISGSSLKYTGPWTITAIGGGVTIGTPVVVLSNANRTIDWSWQAQEQLFIPRGSGITLEFTAKVVSVPIEETITNTGNVTAWGNNSAIKKYGQDCATVNIKPPHPTFEKKVKSGDNWVDATTAVQGDTVRFKLTLTYLGNLNLTHIRIVDTLPNFLQYKSGGGSNVSVSANKKTIWINLSYVMNDGQTYSTEFDTLVNTTTIPSVGVNLATVTATETGPGSYQSSDTVSISIQNNTAPYYPLISGDSSGKTGQKANFAAKSVDTDGDTVFFMFDWNATGGHDYSAWLGPYPQNTVITGINHTYSKAGIFGVKAKAKDFHGLQSDWGNQISITITQAVTPPTPGKNITITSVTGGTSVTATIKNNGTKNAMGANGVNWSITIEGKLLKRKNTDAHGLFNLSAGATHDISLSTKSGFGRVTITIVAKVPGYGEVTRTLTAFQLGKRLLRLK